MLNIVEIQNRMGNGCTEPYMVWCDNGKKYVVKFPGNFQGKRTLVNEYIASKLCELLGLPIFQYELINVRISDYNYSMSKYLEFVEGTAFGTKYNENALPVLNSSMIAKANNNNDAIKILIFDLVMGNYDRNKGNLMIDSIRNEIVMIDHSHIFNIGTLWDEYQLPMLINEDFNVEKLHQYNYNNIIGSIRYDEKFYTELNMFIKKIKLVKKYDIKKIVDSIPTDWDVTTKEKELIIIYICNRLNRVDEILDILDIKGGDKIEI